MMRKLDRRLYGALEEMEISRYEDLAEEYPDDAQLQEFIQQLKDDSEFQAAKRVALQLTKYKSLLCGVLLMTGSMFGTLVPTCILPSRPKIEHEQDTIK